jgi:hypothetical protein
MTRKGLRLGAAALAAWVSLLLSAPAGAMQAAAVEADMIVACGMAAFGEADERLFGQSYAALIADRPDLAPPERKRVPDRLEAQLEACRQRHDLAAVEVEGMRNYSMAETLRRGAAWHLRDSGADMAALDAIAARFTFAELVKDESAFKRRARKLLKATAIPASLHAAAIDYVTFVHGADYLKADWIAAARPGEPPLAAARRRRASTSPPGESAPFAD